MRTGIERVCVRERVSRQVARAPVGRGGEVGEGEGAYGVLLAELLVEGRRHDLPPDGGRSIEVRLASLAPGLRNVSRNVLASPSVERSSAATVSSLLSLEEVHAPHTSTRAWFCTRAWFRPRPSCPRSSPSRPVLLRRSGKLFLLAQMPPPLHSPPRAPPARHPIPLHRLP